LIERTDTNSENANFNPLKSPCKASLWRQSRVRTTVQPTGTVVQLQPKRRTGSGLACNSFWWSARWIWSIRFARCYHFVESYCQLILL